MWTPLTLLLIVPIIPIPVLAANAIPSALTCPYRTVNYITHSLPQQCLTSSRKANSSTYSTTTQNITVTPVPLTSSGVVQHANSTSVYGGSSPSTPTDANSHMSIASPPPSQGESTSSSPSSGIASTSTIDPADEVSPLEDGKFLSFEDWKRENLKKSGQSEHVGQRAAGDHAEPRKRAIIDQGSLDSLGDDAEIDIDFSGFVSEGLEPDSQPQPRPPQPASETLQTVEHGRAPRVGLRSKDAGKTCKERSNYASFDCGANVLKTNPEAKSPLAILGKNKDAYMLNKCSAQNKYVILELCDDIAIDTIVVANFEFFSSIFRTFRVSVSDKYPVKIDKWKTIGTFEARNSRDVQAFLVENSVIWARYLRFEFLTHYGSEYYCPVSLVRVHGTTMLEEYKHDLESLQNEDDEDHAPNPEGNAPLADGLLPDTITTSLPDATHPSESNDTMEKSQLTPDTTASRVLSPANISDGSTTILVASTSKAPSSLLNASFIFAYPAPEDYASDTCTTEDSRSSTDIAEGLGRSSTTRAPTVGSTTVQSTPSSESSTSHKNSSASATGSINTSTSFSTTNATSYATNSTSSKISSASTSTNGTGVRAVSSSTQAAPAAPTMQESFFKSVQKRLQVLESNSSLSLQYIEEQSRALRDAFQKVEQRQMAKTTSFLDYLNNTVLNELREFRQQYDQLWQSTVIELEMQRERYQQENLAINARLGVLADEVIFQKRMSVLQMILLLVCLGLVLFSKGTLNSYLELPLFQNVLSRSPSARWLNLPALDTPTQSPPVTRTNSARGGKRQGILKGHRRIPSDDSVDVALSPSDMYTPSTTVSFEEASDDERDTGDDKTLGDPQFDPSLIERPRTSPPDLPGGETPSAPPTPTSIEYTPDRTIESTLHDSTPTHDFGRPPVLVIEDATPPSKHLKWQLPDI